MLAEELGFERIFGAFAAGMIVGVATRSGDAKPFRDKFDAIVFGWFLPFFFVGTGVKFDITALTQDVTTIALVPIFLVLFLVVRGAPVLLYRTDLGKAERLPFALSSAVPSLSIMVVITEIGLADPDDEPRHRRRPGRRRVVVRHAVSDDRRHPAVHEGPRIRDAGHRLNRLSGRATGDLRRQFST